MPTATGQGADGALVDGEAGGELAAPHHGGEQEDAQELRPPARRKVVQAGLGQPGPCGVLLGRRARRSIHES